MVVCLFPSPIGLRQRRFVAGTIANAAVRGPGPHRGSVGWSSISARRCAASHSTASSRRASIRRRTRSSRSERAGSPVLAAESSSIDGLAGALSRATDGTAGFSAAVRPQARELRDASAVLTALESRLRGSAPVTARGVALLRVLLTDAASPLYQPSAPGELASRLRAAAAALEP